MESSPAPREQLTTFSTAPITTPASANPSADDGTVLCPFCETELPPDLLLKEIPPAAPTTPALALARPKPGALARVDTSVAANQSEASPGMLAPPRSAVSAVRPQITTASLKHSLNESEDAETSATSAIISADDIRRWSQIANIVFVPPPSPIGSDPAGPKSAVSAIASTPGAHSSVPPSPARTVPLIAPPPSAGGKLASPATATSGRFGFFSRPKSKLGMNEDDESDDDELGGATGYARVAGPGSDDDDDGYESDKPFTPKSPKKEEEAKMEAKPEPTIDTTELPTIPTVNIAHSITPETPVDQLRNILGEVLSRVQLLSSSHTDLLSSHSTLLTSLKIARSNLVMAEANTEMLEDELKRVKVPSLPTSARGAMIPDAPRSSTDRIKDGTLTPTPPVRTNSGGFGFWKKSSATDAATPPGPGSPTELTAGGKISHTPQNSGDLREEEVRILRAHIELQSDELEALKQGKKAIEAELEGLSQALFEEANKMVSDERKRRAELEESLREVRDEREALRQTVKVLGGRVQTPVPDAMNVSDGQATGVDSLDQHYAALRRGIHHAVDGPSPAPSDDDRSDNEQAESESRNRSNTVTTLKPNGNSDPRPTLETGMPKRKPSFGEAAVNPWG